MRPFVSARRGVLLLAHGARDPRWAHPFRAVEGRLREAVGDAVVELCFLEFMTPGIVDAGHSLVASGCSEVDVVPLFLGGGGHVRKDVPALIAELQRAHPDVLWRMHPAIGESAVVIDALAAAAKAQLDRPPPAVDTDNGPEQPPAP